jgi:hypothetical protein
MRQTADESGSDRVTNQEHDDRDRRCHSLGLDRLSRSDGYDQIDLQPDEFGREPRNSFRFVVSVAVFEDEVLALDVSEVAETRDETVQRQLGI